MEYAAYDKSTEVGIGTPVEIPEDDARKKPVPIQDQVVTDDRGMRPLIAAATFVFSPPPAHFDGFSRAEAAAAPSRRAVALTCLSTRVPTTPTLHQPNTGKSVLLLT